MKFAVERQAENITDAARARIAMVRPILHGILFAMHRDRIGRLGGYEKITLADLAREYREGSGDCGICFEYAVHEALRNEDPHIHPILSEVLEDFCGIREGAHSILFGAEKNGAVTLIETADEVLTDDSRILVGKTGQPPKLKRHLDRLVAAFKNPKTREKLPASIRGLWRADLFVGSRGEDRWVATTLKTNHEDLEGDAGIRIGIYPGRRVGEKPSHDEAKNLILCPLPYNKGFMELFYASFYIIKHVLNADARVPKPVALPYAEDRHVAEQLVGRRDYPILDVIQAFEPMAQPGLLVSDVAGNQGQVETTAVAPVAQLLEGDKKEQKKPSRR